ncbi:MAG: putative quinol monooxygenase [Pseudomonadota bacterium]
MRFVVSVLFEIHPESMNAFLDLVVQNAKASLANEGGCLQFDVCTDDARPQEVYLYEIYASKEAFGLHLTTDHYKLFDQSIEGMVASKDVKTYARMH